MRSKTAFRCRCALPMMAKNCRRPWSGPGVPEETAAVLVLVEDPDSPTPKPLVHAVVLDRSGRDASCCRASSPATPHSRTISKSARIPSCRAAICRPIRRRGMGCIATSSRSSRWLRRRIPTASMSRRCAPGDGNRVFWQGGCWSELTGAADRNYRCGCPKRPSSKGPLCMATSIVPPAPGLMSPGLCRLGPNHKIFLDRSSHRFFIGRFSHVQHDPYVRGGRDSARRPRRMCWSQPF